MFLVGNVWIRACETFGVETTEGCKIKLEYCNISRCREMPLLFILAAFAAVDGSNKDRALLVQRHKYRGLHRVAIVEREEVDKRLPQRLKRVENKARQRG